METIRKYSNILGNLMKGEYNVTLALALSNPKLFRQLSPKHLRLPEGIKIVTDLPQSIYLNLYESYVVKEYSHYADFLPRDGDTVFDIGAYVGIYTLRNAKRVRDNGLVYAFEPNPSAFARLANNVKINGLTNVQCIPLALGDRAGDQSLYTSTEFEPSSTLFAPHLKNWADSIAEISVQMDTLDHFIAQHGIRRIDVAKIDVEGAEVTVLRGATNALSTGILDKLVIEVHEDVVPLPTLVALLAEYNYAVQYTLNRPRGQEVPKSIIYAKLAG
jgi:FkbM family methyltransferase